MEGMRLIGWVPVATSCCKRISRISNCAVTKLMNMETMEVYFLPGSSVNGDTEKMLRHIWTGKKCAIHRVHQAAVMIV